MNEASCVLNTPGSPPAVAGQDLLPEGGCEGIIGRVTEVGLHKISMLSLFEQVHIFSIVGKDAS